LLTDGVAIAVLDSVHIVKVYEAHLVEVTHNYTINEITGEVFLGNGFGILGHLRLAIVGAVVLVATGRAFVEVGTEFSDITGITTIISRCPQVFLDVRRKSIK
jgi:hypothetical protein